MFTHGPLYPEDASGSDIGSESARSVDRCCCGRIDPFIEPVILGERAHERLGDEGAFCGGVKNHTIRDQDREIERLRAALREIAKPGLTEASAGAMVFEDLESKKRIAREALKFG